MPCMKIPVRSNCTCTVSGSADQPVSDQTPTSVDMILATLATKENSPLPLGYTRILLLFNHVYFFRGLFGSCQPWKIFLSSQASLKYPETSGAPCHLPQTPDLEAHIHVGSVDGGRPPQREASIRDLIQTLGFFVVVLGSLTMETYGDHGELMKRPQVGHSWSMEVASCGPVVSRVSRTPCLVDEFTK